MMKKILLIILCLTAAVFGINKKYIPPQVNTVGLIAYYKLWVSSVTAGKVFDYNLSGHTGTLTGTAALRFPGVELDGDSDYIEIDDHSDFTPAGTPLTISTWVKMTDATSFEIASKGLYDTDGEWIWDLYNIDRVRLMLMDESVASCYIGRSYSVALTSYEGQWIHLAGTYDGGAVSSGIKIYLNGQRIDDTNFESNAGSFVAVENLNHAVWIGRYDNDYANGKIDDVMIFNVVKSAAEIKSIYEQTKWRYGK